MPGRVCDQISCEQALVRRAEDVMHTLAETVPFSERKPVEPWLEDLSRLKENLSSAVQHLYQTLRTVSDFHHTCNRVRAICVSELYSNLEQIHVIFMFFDPLQVLTTVYKTHLFIVQIY